MNKIPEIQTVIQMKTFKEYYKKALTKEKEWYKHQKDEWWRKYEGDVVYDDDNFHYRSDKLCLKGDYLETTRLKSKHERNDSSMISNHTNVNNREWGILFDILGQALIDWLIENEKTDIYAFGFSIKRVVDGLDNFYIIEKEVKILDTEYTWQEIENPDPKFDECSKILCDLVDQFFTKHGNDIPCDWNYFGFGLDDLMHSCEYGEWCPCSDGSLSLGNEHDGEKYDTYDEYVSCL